MNDEGTGLMRWANETAYGDTFFVTCEDAGEILYVHEWDGRFCVSPKIDGCYETYNPNDIAVSLMAAITNCPKMKHWKIQSTENNFRSYETRYTWMH